MIQHTLEQIEGVKANEQYRKNVIERATRRRAGMSNRAIQEFGTFISHLNTYLVFDEPSDSNRFQGFFELLPKECFDPLSIQDYYVAFDLYGQYKKEHDEYHEIVESLKGELEDWENE